MSIWRVEDELAQAEQAWKDGNEGRARVCARRAVSAALDHWRDMRGEAPLPGDTLAHLAWIQERHGIFPREVISAARRLSTKVTERARAPFSTDPLADARLIVDYLMKTTVEPSE